MVQANVMIGIGTAMCCNDYFSEQKELIGGAFENQNFHHQKTGRFHLMSPTPFWEGDKGTIMSGGLRTFLETFSPPR